MADNNLHFEESADYFPLEFSKMFCNSQVLNA